MHSKSTPYVLDHANIEWDKGAPVSRDFDDIYSDQDSALAEKQSVFIDPLSSHIGQVPENAQITVGELGFGFGINTLLCAEYWTTQPSSACLNIISIEKHPVRQQDLKQLISQYDFRFGSKLIDQYPPPYCGQHVIWLADNIRLLLIFDDAERGLANLDTKADFWFLDGFSPSKNESMWQERLYRMIFARSQPGAGVTTYSAAGHVKRGLRSHGFQAEKTVGFGKKRSRLQALRPGTWRCRLKPSGSTLILGGGLAGLYCAEALSRRGLSFALVDDGSLSPSEIPQLSVKPQLAAVSEVHYRFSLAASQYMQSSPGYFNSGIFQIAEDQEERERFTRIAMQFPEDVISENLDHSLYFHRAGWLASDALRDALPKPTHRDHATKLGYDGQWRCELASGEQLAASHVILATGASRNLLPPDIKLRAIRGQAISVPTSDVTQLTSQGYSLFPTDHNRSIVSGTYARIDNLEVDRLETEQLHRAAEELLNRSVDKNRIKTWVGLRATPYDRVPVVGKSSGRSDEEGEHLYLCTAFGSRGATHARLCAEHVVSQINLDPAPLGKREQKLLSPTRLRGRQ